MHCKVWKCHVRGPSILKHIVLDFYSPVLRWMLTLEEARVKSEERMLHVTPIFCDEEEKAQNLTMNRMPQPLEWKVTCDVASWAFYTHKKSTGEYKERMKTCLEIWHSAGFRLVSQSLKGWRFSFVRWKSRNFTCIYYIGLDHISKPSKQKS